MTPEIIEGEAVEVLEPRAVMVVQQPGQSLVAHADNGGPAAMVGVATDLANVLKDIVEQRRLYAVIQGKKYPQVEAWMTIARLDNVVARESQAPIAHEDGSYEAFAELIRLSDGMVIGSASALCGTPDDRPWNVRPLPARRSMAQTRATSRAFRQQYSWIMALAGYEPTPAEEMPRDDAPTPAAPRPVPSSPAGATAGTVSLAGTVKRGNGNGMDLELRQTPDGAAIGFKLMDLEGHPEGKKSIGVRAFGAFALAVAAEPAFEGQRVVVSGQMRPEQIDKANEPPIRYSVLVLETLDGPTFTIPAADTTPTENAAPEPSSADLSDLDSLPW